MRRVDLFRVGPSSVRQNLLDSGDFVIALDDPLKPGDYQLVLRSTAPDGTAMTSLETAIVSIPEVKTGEVLALVEQSGQPSRMITKPQAKEPAVPDPGQTATAAAPKGDKPVAAPAAKALVSVEAVEIEGNKIFIAGTAEAGTTVKVYANTDLLGTTKTSPNGRFLVQTVQELAVGDYIIRADMLGKDGVTVVARAAVPFKREAGERIAAVAPKPLQPRLMVLRRPLAPSHRRQPVRQPQVADARRRLQKCRRFGDHSSWRQSVADFPPHLWRWHALHDDLSGQQGTDPQSEHDLPGAGVRLARKGQSCS